MGTTERNFQNLVFWLGLCGLACCYELMCYGNVAMIPEENLQRIDDELVKQAETIAAARTCVKDLHDERKVVALEVEQEKRKREHEERVEEARKWREANSKEHDGFMKKIRHKNQENVIEGFLMGWWDLDENGEMLAPAKVFKLSDFADVKTPLMAHVMAKAEIFTSIGQARKNGWNTPLVVGEWTVGKNRTRVVIR